MVVAKVWLLWMAVSLWMADPMERMEFGLRSGGQVPQRGVGMGGWIPLMWVGKENWKMSETGCHRRLAKRMHLRRSAKILLRLKRMNCSSANNSRHCCYVSSHCHCFRSAKSCLHLRRGNTHRHLGNLRHHPGLGLGHQEWQESRMPPAR